MQSRGGGEPQQAMSPQQAMQILQQLGIDQQMLPVVAMAIQTVMMAMQQQGGQQAPQQPPQQMQAPMGMAPPGMGGSAT